MKISDTIIHDSVRPVQKPDHLSVDPTGSFYAERGFSTFMGNRGVLRNTAGVINRKSQSSAWIVCELSRKGLSWNNLRAVSYTRLFFLDEATALTAGHRPCGLCRAAELRRFRSTIDESAISLSITKVDKALRNQCGADSRRMAVTTIGWLPAGSFFKVRGFSDEIFVKGDEKFMVWTANGYLSGPDFSSEQVVTLLTPRIVVHALNNGYRPCFHPSALDNRRAA